MDKQIKNGQIKCKYCGATDIYLNENSGLLKCNYCRNEFEPEKVNKYDENLKNLQGSEISAGAQNIMDDAQDIVTFRCQGCGAEVVIDTSETTQARCHWCRSFLSVNEQVPNGVVPDVVLPFAIKKSIAEEKIKEFVNKRKFFANSKFKKEFTTNNILGVYFPYMLVDINAHANFEGEGEHLVRQYTVGSKDNSRTYYDADLYNVGRDFDIVIDDLSVESNNKSNTLTKVETTNIINSIMPFDTENCVAWNANYLKGFSSEKRDINVEDLRGLVETQTRDISRIAIHDTLKYYNRGVSWQKELLNIKGERWKAAYLPVWLYSYKESKGNRNIIHYVAVNARTGETMGSVPVNIPKLLFMSFIFEIIGIFLMFFIESDYDWILLLTGFVFYLIMYTRYRNTDKRHVYEKDTKKQVSNVKSIDNFVEHRTRLSNSYIKNANHRKLYGTKNGSLTLEHLIELQTKK